MEIRGVDQMLSELQGMAQAASGKLGVGAATPGIAPGADAPGVDFGSVLNGALRQVSQAQEGAQQMAREFSAGTAGVNLQDVMINLQKASIAFQQVVQVRNRLVAAYQDVMNMQV